MIRWLLLSLCLLGCSAVGPPLLAKDSREGLPVLAPRERRVALGLMLGCAIHRDALQCWGSPDEAPAPLDPRWTGHTTIDSCLNPRRVVLPEPPIAIAMSDGQGHHGCVLLPGGAVRCWGDNRDGSAGTGRCTRFVREPVVVSLPSPASAIAALGGSSCALVEGGEVYCWGAVQPVPHPTRECSVYHVLTPEGVPLAGVARLEVGIAIDGSGTVWTWRDGSSYGSRADLEAGPAPEAELRAHRVDGLPAPAFDVAMTESFAYALLRKGELWRWDARSPSPVPARIRAETVGRSLACERDDPCLMAGADGYVWGWVGDGPPVRGYPGSPTSLAIVRGGCMSRDDVTSCWGQPLDCAVPDWEEIPGPVEIPFAP